MPAESVETDCTATSSPSRKVLPLGGAVIVTVGLLANTLQPVIWLNASNTRINVKNIRLFM
jgi:hypothetical protein